MSSREDNSTAQEADARTREAVAQRLGARRRDQLDQAIREYVDAMAGSGADLDPELEEVASLALVELNE